MIGDAEYELCAFFLRASETPEGAADFWSHGAGRTCFRVRAERVSRDGPRGDPAHRPGI